MSKTTVSYSVNIIDEYRILRDTISVFKNAVSFVIPVVLENYSAIKDISFINEKQREIEKLIHNSKNVTAKYPKFDKKFKKLPSYLRRDAIKQAISAVTSHKALIKQWEDDGKNTKKPKLNHHPEVMPVLYKGNMFEVTGDYTCRIKIFHNNDWVWHDFKLRKSDVNYIQKRFPGALPAPKLEKSGIKYRLRFSYEVECFELPETVNRICSVDLGVNNDAVCSIMNKDGTVIARKFINSPFEKDRLNCIIEQIKAAQSNGAKKCRKLWRFADNYNREISIKTANAITDFALSNDAECIVFEYLNIKGKKIKGGKRGNKYKIHLWRYRDIQKRTESLAHRFGMRVSRVNAINTSNLAYDGSGKVKRDKDNYSLCTFSSGKKYNCDLSASYNIGARYFLRNIINNLKKKELMEVQAKLPELSKRTLCTLSTLISLNKLVVA